MVLLLGATCILSAKASVDNMKSSWSVYVWQSDGLPDKKVTGLAQTSDGYLWVATPGGLARFDGIHFDEFSPSTLLNGRHHRVRLMLAGRDGGFWLATEHGPVICLKEGKAKVFTADAFNSVPLALVEDKEGALWISHHGGSVSRITNNRVMSFDVKNGLPASGDCSLVDDSKGRLWFAKGGVVGLFRDEKFVGLAELEDRDFSLLGKASSGGIWICSNAQLLKYDEGGEINHCGSFDFKGTHRIVKSNVLLEDHSGGVWIGTHNGLLRYNGSDFENVPTSHQQILSVVEDRENNIWVGTGGGGVDRIQPRWIELEGTETGLPSESIQSICEDTNGQIWAATQDGLLVCRTGSGWTPRSTGGNWPGGMVTDIAADHEGAIWIATNEQKLFCWRDDRCVATWGTAEGLINRSINTLLVSKTDEVWMSYDGGHAVQCLNKGKLHNYKLPRNDCKVRAMAEDATGTIWMGLKSGSLLRINGDILSEQSVKINGAPKSINCLYPTSDGSVWIGYSNGGGLGRLKDGQVVSIGVERGLYDDNIAQIVADDRGWLWFGTDHGIFKARKEQLDAVADGRAARFQSVRYGKNEGLPNLHATFDDVAGTLHSRDGRLWIPMGTALAVIDPNKLYDVSEPPPTLLKKVTTDTRIVALYEPEIPAKRANAPDLLILSEPEATLRLASAPRKLEFEFTALSFKSPDDVQFRYRLEGFDESWIETRGQRNASYTRLPAGNYRFWLKACNSDGIWNEKGAAISIFIAPLFWETWWFRALVLALFTVAVVVLVRYISFRQMQRRLQALEQQAALDRERSRIARDLHDDLGSHLTKIALLSELTQLEQADSEQVTERTKQISVAAREVIKSLDETVWTVNPRNDTLESLINYIGQFAVEFLQTAEIRCQVDFLEHSFDRPVSAAVRHNLSLVVKEALHNVVKHANASEVSIRIDVRKEAVRLWIEDNGRGFEATSHGPDADGLLNMRQRMEEIGGEFSFESKPGCGTRILLIFALRGEAKQAPTDQPIEFKYHHGLQSLSRE